MNTIRNRQASMKHQLLAPLNKETVDDFISLDHLMS